ncbi:MAG TPA: hypothetical protein DCS43_05750 [Verrucomicrobia bacterium]|nr:hypothetical protein [Verrucomicrobiota bacterium]
MNGRRVLALFGAAWFVAGAAMAADIPPVVIDYYFAAGCPECIQVNAQIMPEVELRYDGFYTLNKWETGVASNYYRLAALLNARGIKNNASVIMVVDQSDMLFGFSGIRDGLFDCLDRQLAERLQPGWSPAEGLDTPPGDMSTIQQWADAFSVTSILLAGLLDGVNPCAISTLVFLMSILTAFGLSRRQMVVMGMAYILATFLTYTAIGLGVLRGLYLLQAFPLVRRGFEIVLGVGMALLAWFSFRDAWRFHRNRDPQQISLQLPSRLKRLIHAALRRGVGGARIAVTGFVAGALVTALESVCTGQVYVPTLALIIRQADGTLVKAGGLLLSYNIMFLVPLSVAFLLVFFGAGLDGFRRWNLLNVTMAKVLMGCFFVAVCLFFLTR